MKIDKFRIRNYRSILDTGYVNLEQDITLLLGKNESGKTTILKSLEYFGTNKEYSDSDLPSHSDLETKHDISGLEIEDIPIADIQFSLDDHDKEVLEEIHPALKSADLIKCTKFFDDHFDIEIPNVDLDALENPEQIYKDSEIETNIIKINAMAKEFKGDLDSFLENSVYMQQKSNFEDALDELINFKDPRKIENLDLNKLKQLINLRDPHNTIILSGIDEFLLEIEYYKKEIINDLSKDVNTVTDQILGIMPNFMYFSTVEELDDEAHWGDLKNNKDKFKTIRNLLYLSDLDMDIDDYENRSSISKAQNASARVTGLVNEYWTQDKVKIELYITNDKVMVSVWDDIIKSFQEPSVRSQGFQWFLSFYINFTVDSNEELKNTIILLDDPGVYLHSGGQKDLINTLEKLSESNQIVLATHSPFMINKNKLTQIRLVTKEQNKGTTITEKFYKSNYDALAPVRAAIGMSLGDSLFIGKRTLVAEGITDDILLKPLSKLLSKMDENFIDTSKITFLDVNSADKTKFYLPFLLNENIEFLILLDYDEKGREKAKELKNQFGTDLNIMMCNEVKNVQGDVEIEDLFDFKFYLKAVNLAYKDLFIEKLNKESLEETEFGQKSFKGIKNYFRKSDDFSRLDKVLVAKQIVKLINNDDKPNKNSISNFSKLFKLINERLEI